MSLLYTVYTIATLFFVCVVAQSYEDKRCRCICPSPAAVINNTQSNDQKLFYTVYVPPNQCNCDGVILPRVGNIIKGHEQEFCPRCDCKYETRNTMVIMVVVIMVLWMLTLLAVYMGFLVCLDPFINKKRVKHYQERGSDEARSLLLQGDDPED